MPSSGKCHGEEVALGCVIIIATGGYLIGAIGIGIALGARLKIDSLEKEKETLLYPETPATRSVVFSGTSVLDAAASTLTLPDDFGRERGRVLSRTG